MGTKKVILKNLLWMTFGSVVYAAGIALFISPNSLAPGGVTGIAVMLSDFLPLNTGLLTLLINIPLLLIGLWQFGRRFLLQTVYATVLSSLLIEVFLKIPPLSENLLLAGLAGGALTAAGMGIIFRAGGTTGGTDILVKLIRRKYQHLRTGRIFMMFDALVVTISAFVYRDVDRALYAAVTLVVSSVLLDLVLYGTDGARLVYVISDKSNELAEKMMQNLDVGVTLIDGEGAYKKTPQRVILCAVKKPVFPKLKALVAETDPNAFLIVTSAGEIFGEGFKHHGAEEL